VDASLLIALFSLFISFGALGLRLWELLIRRPRFKAEYRWSFDSQERLVGATLVVMNVGHAKGAIMRVGFGGPNTEDHRLWSQSLYDEFPLVLDVNEVSPRFPIDLSTYDRIALGLRDGDLTMIAIQEINGQETLEPIPAKPDLTKDDPLE
jgi:hypothetical protein